MDIITTDVKKKLLVSKYVALKFVTGVLVDDIIQPILKEFREQGIYVLNERLTKDDKVELYLYDNSYFNNPHDLIKDNLFLNHLVNQYKTEEYSVTRLVFNASKDEMDKLKLNIEDYFENFGLTVSFICWSSKFDLRFMQIIHNKEISDIYFGVKPIELEFPKTKEDLSKLLYNAINLMFYYRESSTSHFPERNAVDHILNAIK